MGLGSIYSVYTILLCHSFLKGIHIYYIGVLITGGNGNKAEIYLPDSNTSCVLPGLPEERNYHTQDGDLACGGLSSSYLYNTQKSCVKWTNGAWTRSHNLREERSFHVSWVTASGVYLIGGWGSFRTSELIKEDGSVEEGFNLKYNTW